ncbi:MAG TPA: TraB/GumN family protein [Steroidobacteraceae bacterium]|nr:TraB/GumN family protein [Steroidobacteraceae bacterium]
MNRISRLLSAATAGAALLCASPALPYAGLAPAQPVSTPASPAQAPDESPAGATQAQMATEEVVIEGQHAGPQMWRVSKADHVMWVLGTISPLPRRMTWQSDAVEGVLRESQEVLPAWPSIGVGANPFTALRLYFTWRKIQKSPDRMKLREQLPPELYARFTALKNRFAPGDDRIEELRPMLAGGRLLDKAFETSGLTMRNEVQRTVLRLASRQGVKAHQTRMKVEDPVDVLKDLGETPKAGEIACLAAIITRLETDLGPMQARARAWALGDVDTLRKLPHSVDDRIACLAAVSASERIRNLVTRAEEDWIVEAQDALARNRSTLAVQSMDRLLGDHGILAELRAKGYAVDGP